MCIQLCSIDVIQRATTWHDPPLYYHVPVLKSLIG